MIRDIPAKIFKIILNFLYFDIIIINHKFNVEDWLQLLKYAKFYDIERIV